MPRHTGRLFSAVGRGRSLPLGLLLFALAFPWFTACGESSDRQSETPEKIPLPDLSPNEPYPVVFQGGVPIVRDADGEATVLYANIFRPDAPGRFPALLEGIAYRREFLQIAQGPKKLAENGYVVILLDVRGTGSAEGKWGCFSEEEIEDHVWMIDQWIPRQEWSNGKVGLFGPSYMGINQLLSAGRRPAHLKAIFPGVSMADAYRDIFYQGGIFNEEFILFWALTTAGLSVLPGTQILQDPIACLNTIIEHAQQIPELFSWLAMTTDQPFFEARSPMYLWDTLAEFPIMMTGGWFDIFTRGSLLNYINTEKRAGEKMLQEPDLVAPKRLIVGPWYHMTGALMQGVPFADLHLRWFDWHMKADEDPLYSRYDIMDPSYPVMLYVLGAEQWRKETAWPLQRARYTTFYLSGKRQEFDRNASLNNGSLLSEEEWSVAGRDAADMAPSIISHNPPQYAGLKSRATTRWLVGATSFLPADEDERENEEHTLTFSTAPLDRDVEVTGPVLLRFWAKTNRFDPVSGQGRQVLDGLRGLKNLDLSPLADRMEQNDVQWIVNLNDVYPDGRSRNLTSGWLAASHRGDPDRPYHTDPAYDPFDYPENRNPSPIEAGKPYEYVIEIWPTCNLFREGHQIRIDIANSDVPHLLPSLVPSQSEILHDSEHPARLILPVVDPDTTDPALWIQDPGAYVRGEVPWD